MFAEVILINGKVFTFEDDTKKAEAIAVKDGIIAAVGSNAKIMALMDENTKVIDCNGNSVLPGLCDAHCHPGLTASKMMGCDLYGVQLNDHNGSVEAVIEEYLNRLKEYIDTHPDEKIIRGVGWNNSNFKGVGGIKRLPNRFDLDKICPEKPVVLESFCQHNFWVNSKALEIAGVTKDTPETEEGIIERDKNGEPIGVLRDFEAMGLIRENLPGYDFSVEQYKEVIKNFQKENASNFGITMITDALCTENAMQAYKELAEDGELNMRVRGCYNLANKDSRKTMDEILSRSSVDKTDSLFAINTVKIFLEGTLCMCEPYEAEFNAANGLPADFRGDLFWNDEELTAYMREIINAGLQIHVHAMGDRSVKQAVNCIAEAQKSTNEEQRNVIAHVMLIKDEDLELMGNSNIMCSCQPRWMVHDTDIEDAYVRAYGKERAYLSFPNKKLMDAGCIVAYGTDFPVTPPPNPFHGIQCAITREVFKDASDYDRFKGKILKPDECVKLRDAIKATSWNGAYQNFLENITGSIEVGKSADIVVLDKDIESIPVEEIYDIKVKQTLFKGNIVYEQ